MAFRIFDHLLVNHGWSETARLCVAHDPKAEVSCSAGSSKAETDSLLARPMLRTRSDRVMRCAAQRLLTEPGVPFDQLACELGVTERPLVSGLRAALGVDPTHWRAVRNKPQTQPRSGFQRIPEDALDRVFGRVGDPLRTMRSRFLPTRTATAGSPGDAIKLFIGDDGLLLRRRSVGPGRFVRHDHTFNGLFDRIDFALQAGGNPSGMHPQWMQSRRRNENAHRGNAGLLQFPPRMLHNRAISRVLPFSSLGNDRSSSGRANWSCTRVRRSRPQENAALTRATRVTPPPRRHNA